MTEAMEHSREEFRVMIFYDFKRGLSEEESHNFLRLAFGDSAPSIDTVKRWFVKFRKGKEEFEDQPRSGRPREAVTPDNVERARLLIKECRNVTYEQIEKALGIGSAAAQKILHDQLGVRRLVSRWIPHLLTDDQKAHRVEWCRFMLNKFDEGRSKRVAEIVTGDETWIYSYDPETKQQSTVWVFEDEELPTKVVRGKSAAKQMVALFFRRQGLVAAVPLEVHKTVTAQWYCEVCLPEVFNKLEEERPTAGLRGILLHHDNAPAHTAAKTLDFLHERGVQLVTHPPYSPDLAPCDFALFPELKKHLRGKRFESEKAAVAAMNEVLDDMPKTVFQDCFEKWFWRMHKCIGARGGYFEKQ